MRDHIFGVAAVPRNAGHFAVDQAHREIAAAAGIAVAATAAEPADAHALADFPAFDALSQHVDHAGRFVAGHAGIADAGPPPFLS